MATHKINEPLLIDNIALLLQQLVKLINHTKEITIDLSGVNAVDSAGIAFLLELKNIARIQSSALTFTNITEEISNLCQLYKVKL